MNYKNVICKVNFPFIREKVGIIFWSDPKEDLKTVKLPTSSITSCVKTKKEKTISPRILLPLHCYVIRLMVYCTNMDFHISTLRYIPCDPIRYDNMLNVKSNTFDHIVKLSFRI